MKNKMIAILLVGGSYAISMLPIQANADLVRKCRTGHTNSGDGTPSFAQEVCWYESGGGGGVSGGGGGSGPGGSGPGGAGGGSTGDGEGDNDNSADEEATEVCRENAQDLYGPCFSSREQNSKTAFNVCIAGAALLPVKAVAAAAAFACAETRGMAQDDNQQYCLDRVIDAQAECKP